MSEQEGITSRKEDFSEWYNEVVLKAGLADFSSVKGFMFIKPYGFSIWERIQEAFNGMIKESGHQNAFCPSVIPESFLRREKDQFEGFSPEVFRITESGSSRLEEPLILKPTGETIIYDAYSRWVRSWRDLPLKMNFWNSSFRAEIKMTKLFIRTCEFLWQEGHTVHATEKEAEEEVMLILDYYRQLSEGWLAVPVLAGRKSEKEKFPGALRTAALEALMPDGKALQMGTSHNLGQNFSKAFDIGFLDENQKRQLGWQTSWGVSTRLIGALIMVHGDDKGLVLPPKIAPIEAVIIPIYKDSSKENVLKEAGKLASSLKGFRIHLDSRDSFTPGWKFNEWEMKGVPVRIELGPKDIESKQTVLVRRDTGIKKAVPMAKLEVSLRSILDEIQASLLEKARAFLEANTRKAADMKGLEAALEKRGFILAGWCGSQVCEDRVKEGTTADIRVIPFKPAAGKCLVCGKPGKQVYFAKAY